MVTSLAEIKTVYSIQSKNKSNPITQHCNTEAFIKKKKETKYRAKEKQNTEQKRNPKPTVAWPLLAGAARSVTSAAPRLVVVPRSPVVVARRPPSSLVAGPSSLARRRRSERSHHLSCSNARPIGLNVFLPLFLSDSLSLSLSLSL